MAGIADFPAEWRADCRLMMEIGSSCYTTSSIVNRQSAIGNELIPSALGYTCRHLVS
jgi:hypothetical protein